MMIYKYKIKVGNKTYLIGFMTDTLEKIFDYYKVPYEKIKEDK